MPSPEQRHVFVSGGLLPLLGLPPVVAAMLAETGRPAAKLCLVPTGDETDLRWVTAVERLLEGSSTAVSHLRLFPMPNVADPADLLLSADAVFVGGGSTANMLALWRVHGLDQVLRQAWGSGAVLGGTSAGAMCWFDCSLTDSFGPQLAPLPDGLGLLSGSFCPHYDRELRRARFLEVVGDGALPGGIGCPDGVTAHFVDGDLVDVLTERRDGRAWRLTRQGDEVVETPIAGRTIGG